ncbi:DUF6119 family protein [Lentzea sp. NPDC005914]|uniref:DUF6119 family protein n=1 Tax=Lentzea sp. NPDC005914 TaxID=3154572 RepID=UPI0033D55050
MEQRLLKSAEGVTGWRLFVRRSFEQMPNWYEHLQPIMVLEDAQRITTRSAGAVLLVQAHKRIFAITFGTGFHAVDAALVEPDFGLKVAANCIDEDGLTLADARGLGKGKRNATSRLAQPGAMFALGLLTDEEWIRQFGGAVNIPGFAKSAKGADALQLNIDDFSLFDLSMKLRQALDLYESDAYRENFPFLDYFRRETDKDTIEILDGMTADAMRARDPEIGFALPDEFDLITDRYQLSRRRRKVSLAELRTEDVYAAIDGLNGWADPLKSVKVEAFDFDSGEGRGKEPLRRYVVGSVRYEVDGVSRDYAMTAGVWFRVAHEYAESIDLYLEHNVPDVTDDLALPEWDDKFLEENIEGKYGEIRYNRYACRELGHGMLDRDLYRGRAGENVEYCDQLSAHKKLICVKRMDGSDKMSHLFQQGSVSAQLIMTNDEYKAGLMEKLQLLDADAEFGSPLDWTVVYAIATSKPAC